MRARLAPVLKTIFHQCVISYTCSQSNSDGSVLKQSHQRDWIQVYEMTHWWKIVLSTGASLDEGLHCLMVQARSSSLVQRHLCMKIIKIMSHSSARAYMHKAYILHGYNSNTLHMHISDSIHWGGDKYDQLEFIRHMKIRTECLLP